MIEVKMLIGNHRNGKCNPNCQFCDERLVNRVAYFPSENKFGFYCTECLLLEWWCPDAIKDILTVDASEGILYENPQ